LSNLVQGIKYPDAQNQEFLGALVAPWYFPQFPYQSVIKKSD
jgi:hypothetical protein